MICASLTYDGEGEVKGHAAEAIGRLAHIESSVFGFHVLDLEAVLENTVTVPARIDVSSILRPEQQGFRVTFDWASQADVTP